MVCVCVCVCWVSLSRIIFTLISLQHTVQSGNTWTDTVTPIILIYYTRTRIVYDPLGLSVFEYVYVYVYVIIFWYMCVYVHACTHSKSTHPYLQSKNLFLRY